MSIAGGFPYAVSFSGNDLFFANSGPEFLTGTIATLNLQLITLEPNISFTDLMNIYGVTWDASETYSLIERSGTTISGRFEPAAFQAELANRDYEITGSNDADFAALSNVIALDGDDGLFGFGDDDTLFGGSGPDRLDGGAGSDTMSGGEGSDVFIFTAGRDIIRDFDAFDRIDLSDVSGISGFGNLAGRLSQSSNDVVLFVASGQVLILEDVLLNELSAADFIF